MRLSNFNELTKWSNLARLASGNLPKLTIAAPFIAFIIFHNEPLQPFLSLSEERHSSPTVELLSRARFDIFYLGLVIVGSGVALFTLFCPRQITAYRGYEDFISSKEATKTANGIAGSLRFSIADFLRDARDTDEVRDEAGGSLKYPRRFREGLISLVRSGSRAALTDEQMASAGNIARDSDPEVREVLRQLDDSGPDPSGFKSKFYDNLHLLSIDVFRLEYLKADYSKPSARAATFWLIVMGTTVVLIPTVITTILVISDLFSVTTQQPFFDDGM
ncbi:hypothetical protein GQ651_05145 [Alphaproteobacteria bacterium GH1-50]|uniref:Uncharacterized protein n=1 Tax=Kangsaoukella pontilimi TaxID=2691042 RepID=A0A7C9IR90_9RHOB|nr:hypothetical protein [Kangsaoukella pontilimi]MXQ07226.1 hypothetical protein [Kangsaoukella pontilimi]